VTYRIRCHRCQNGLDFTDSIEGWTEVIRGRSLGESMNLKRGDDLDWNTHTGLCPECSGALLFSSPPPGREK
jgi:hypothetical protein